MKRAMTNKEFAVQNAEFRKACSNAGIEPTSRQASKYRNKCGLAYQSKKGGE